MLCEKDDSLYLIEAQNVLRPMYREFLSKTHDDVHYLKHFHFSTECFQILTVYFGSRNRLPVLCKSAVRFNTRGPIFARSIFIMFMTQNSTRIGWSAILMPDSKDTRLVPIHTDCGALLRFVMRQMFDLALHSIANHHMFTNVYYNNTQRNKK